MRWETGRLTLPAHPDVEAELVLGAAKPQRVTLTETWAGHVNDLALTAGLRCAADTVSADLATPAEMSDQLSASQARFTSMQRRRTARLRFHGHRRSAKGK